MGVMNGHTGISEPHCMHCVPAAEGVYHADRCSGIHDKPVDPAQAKQLSDAALRIAARPWGKPGSKWPVHYGTQFEAAVTMSRRASGRVSTSHSAVRWVQMQYLP